MPALKQAVAFLFRRTAATELPEDEFVRQASLDLHWFSPKDARRFLEAARSLGYVRAGAAPRSVRASFDAGEVDVPIDFRATAAILSDVPEPSEAAVVEDLVRAGAAARGVGIEAVWADVRRKQEEKLLQAPAAALLVAAHAGVDVGPFVARVKEELARLSSEGRPTPSAS